ncbi:GNAT family N-acetyltransferase [Pseudomonas sp. S9]|uniref:GNAT family N-acetyltransferase n=1 Tax=Pseudomonas sp. S9 TaxID=686578 RepID=UPI000255710B|nr:GNAT family N-acetyltransferase [Pseudomonas sp. S9]
MPATRVRLLPEALKPLANKFYGAHRSKMKATHEDQVWVVEHTQIIAALCLRPVASGHWLTSLFVAPEHRLQGHARELIKAVTSSCNSTVWLFCHPSLSEFYQASGFSPEVQLPEQLSQRLARYQRSKSLIALAAQTSQAL